ncbi:MAG TPA: GreA/GreB family elongation factor, partial [Alphaproteobacteria bacterium]|nr:GreA/GreB family elongation factor [Alphaproteobacteria bacterium]
NEDTDEETTYRIVGSEESDIRSGLLSVTSPLARAMIGKSEGDSIEVVTPKGERGYEIVKIEFG